MRRTFPTTDSKHIVAIGTDNVIGPFMTIWKLDSRFPYDDFRNQPDSTNTVIDMDSITREEMSMKLTEYGVPITNELGDTINMIYDASAGKKES